MLKQDGSHIRANEGNPLAHRELLDSLPIDTSTIIRNGDFDALVDDLDSHLHGACGRLAGGNTNFDILDAVIDCIHNQVPERLPKEVDDLTIQLDIFALELKSDVLVHSPAQISNELGKRRNGLIE